MGRLVRRYIRTAHLEATNSIAVAGTSEAVKGTMTVNLTSGVLNIVGVHAKTSSPTEKNQGGGYQYGVYIENEVLGTATFAGLLEGIRLEQYTEATTIATGQTVYAIHVANSIGKAPSSYYFMRLSEDGIGNLDAIFLITKGATCPDMKYLFEIVYGAAIGMLATVGTVTGAAGYLKVKCNAAARYIQLYSTPP